MTDVNYLQRVEEGERIKASVTNSNNNYLDNKIDSVSSVLTNTITGVSSSLQSQLASLFPIGAIYLSVTETCPLEGSIGHWEKVSSGRVLQGSDDTHSAGSTITAGLPNITGTITDPAFALDFNTAYGAFQGISIGHRGTGGSEYNRGNYGGFTLDASRSSSVYGNSETVQPPAFVVNIWKRVS